MFSHQSAYKYTVKIKKFTLSISENLFTSKVKNFGFDKIKTKVYGALLERELEITDN